MLLSPESVGRQHTPDEALKAFRLAAKIFPGLDGKPGANDAGVAEYLDYRLSRSPLSDQKLYRQGLAAVSSLDELIDKTVPASIRLREPLRLGEPRDEEFLGRYRPLLQTSAALASAHGELKRLLDALPPESQNSSEKLHARHVWAMRCKHQPH